MNEFLKVSNRNNGVRDILRRSSKAICSPTEKEVLISCSKAKDVINKLNKSDYRVIGTSYNECPVKIWFIPRLSVI